MGGWAIAIHGGAGVDPNLPAEHQAQAKQLLARCLNLGISALRSSRPAIDVVELVVRELETDPFFNSGRGSALSEKGTVEEMEASIMDGSGRRCGSISGVTAVKNPISLARLVMDKSPHSYLAFSGAEDFARQHGLGTMTTLSEDNKGMLKQAKLVDTILFDYRIPLDSCGADISLCTRNRWVRGSRQRGSLCSCHFYRDKMTGRIGDSPLIGAGTYARDLSGVSCTGEGEAIIRGTLVRDGVQGLGPPRSGGLCDQVKA